MSYKDTIKAGLAITNKLVASLLISTNLVRPSQSAYVPGSPITETTTLYPVILFIDKFSYNELQSTMIENTDIKIVFTDIGDIVPEVEDAVVINSVNYRLISVKPIYAGNEVVAAEAIGRPE